MFNTRNQRINKEAAKEGPPSGLFLIRIWLWSSRLVKAIVTVLSSWTITLHTAQPSPLCISSTAVTAKTNALSHQYAVAESNIIKVYEEFPITINTGEDWSGIHSIKVWSEQLIVWRPTPTSGTIIIWCKCRAGVEQRNNSEKRNKLRANWWNLWESERFHNDNHGDQIPSFLYSDKVRTVWAVLTVLRCHSSIQMTIVPWKMKYSQPKLTNPSTM